MDWKQLFRLKEKDTPEREEQKQAHDAAVVINVPKFPTEAELKTAEDEARHMAEELRPPDPAIEIIEKWNTAVEGWTGETVRDLQAVDLMDAADAHTYFFRNERLSSTVPEGFRGEVWAATVEGRAQNGTRALWMQSAEIIAIDKAGDALVRSYSSDVITSAESWDFTVMPKEDAFGRITEYRNSHERQAEVGQEGRSLAEAAGMVLGTAQDPINKTLRGVADLTADKQHDTFYSRLGISPQEHAASKDRALDGPSHDGPSFER